jgi:NADPH-dependent 2,4-dienoyl-CoA reductase/sulfur reductase-like enzyme/rhodanese-related sulfurtransferase
VGLRVVVVGGVALGPKVACRLRRILPDAEITVVDQGRYVSYGGCGLPYYLADEVPDETALMSTSFHARRDPGFFRAAKGVTLLPLTRALGIDRARRSVEVEDVATGERRELPYDRLVLGTGSFNAVPPVPGTALAGVVAVHNMENALAFKRELVTQEIRHAVVIGGGAIGVEVTEALADVWDVRTTVVERLGHLLPQVLDPAIAGILAHHLREKGVEVRTGESVAAIEGEGRVSAVRTDRRTLPADLVVISAGVRPNDALARAAGLAVAPGGGIVVDEQLRTSDPAIHAGGDCVVNRSLVAGGTAYAPLGSLANRHGRVIADAIAGRPARFDGIVGSFIARAFDLAVASAGLTLARARAAGFDAERALVVGYDRAHFMPGKALLFLELVVDRRDRRVLGIQGAGTGGDAVAARVDAVAALLRHRPTVEEIGNLEVAYSPPYASALDVVNAAGHVAANLLDGVYRRLEADAALRLLADPDSDVLFLDLNAPKAAAPYCERHPGRWLNVRYEQLADRLDEVPRDRTVVTICDSGIRSYESQVLLAARGYPRVFAMEGGLNVLKRSGRDPIAGPEAAPPAE